MIYLYSYRETEALDIMDAAKEIGLTEAKYMWLLTSSSIGGIGRGTQFPVGILGKISAK
jgi:hypothetical protein